MKQQSAAAGRRNPLARRALIAMLGSTAVAWPRTAVSQAAAQPKLVGILFPAAEEAERPMLAAFRARLAELSYNEGREYRLAIRYTSYADRDLVRHDAEALIGLGPAVIVTGANVPALAVHQLASPIPLVFAGVGGDPVVLGLAQSFPHPGGKATGVVMTADNAIAGKQLALLRELAPAIKRVDGLFGSATAPDVMQVAADAALKLGLDLRIVTVSSKVDVLSALAPASNVADALYLNGNPLFNTMREEIVALVARLQRPAIYGQREMTQAGGLMSYDASIAWTYRVAAEYVVKILGGAAPGDLPIQQASVYELVINLKTAKALGLAVPPTLLARADEVIE